MKYLIIVFSLILASNVLYAKTYYLDPNNGSLSNPGTAAAPLASFSDVINADLIKTQAYFPLPYSIDSELQIKNPNGLIEGGDTLILKAGLHGVIFLRNFNNESNITVIGEEGGLAILERVHLQACKNWIFQGLHISSEPYGYYHGERLFYIESHGFHGPSSNITVQQCDIYSAAEPWTLTQDWMDNASDGLFIRADSCLAIGNKISNIDMGLFCDGDHITAVQNEIVHFSGDGGRILGSHIDFSYNIIRENYNVDDNHDDGIQSFTTTGSIVDSNTVVGNLIIDTEDLTRPLQGPLQGIGGFDGFYNDWFIANNVISVNNWNGIALLGANRCTIIHNTVIDPTPMITPGGSWIKIDEHKDGTPSTDCLVANNVSNKIIVRGGMEINNVTLGTQGAYADHFVDFNTWDFTLLPNSSLVDNADPNFSMSTDYYNNTRDALPDIGAIEYQLPNIILPSQDETIAVHVFPNPFRDKISIEHTNPTTIISLYDVRGIFITRGTLTDIHTHITNLNAGIYFFVFKNEGQVRIAHAVKI